MKAERYVLAYRAQDLSVETSHFDGIPWHEAPKPFWLHRCRAQTFGFVNWFTVVERCRCGAIRLDGNGWLHRNSR